MLIDACNIKKVFNGRKDKEETVAISDLSMKIEQNEFVAIVESALWNRQPALHRSC